MNPIDALAPDELHAYALALKLEAMAFYLPPSEAFLAHLVEGDLLEGWPLGPDDPLTQRGLRLVHGALQLPAGQLLPALRSEYTALFIGLEQVDAPPWESVYLSPDHLLFDVQTLQVREAYAAYGLEIPNLDHEPDDHIGYELLFLSHLLAGAAEALAQGEAPAAAAPAAAERLRAARAFLHEHPQRWAGQFAERVDRFASGDYYRGLAFLLLGSLAGLDAVLAAVLAEGQA